uniref:Uncharacterized protein n=1 Tax=Globisporangium ultimum (strain ATCC 200006 / CBS 805.95 / DAOM BR144) TaxID=431595 RepID=K3WG83_GLOUD
MTPVKWILDQSKTGSQLLTTSLNENIGTKSGEIVCLITKVEKAHYLRVSRSQIDTSF